MNKRANLIPAEHAYVDPRDEAGNIARLARTLAEYPEGQRVIKMGTASPLWKAYYKRRFCFFDREFDTLHRHGLSLERWYRMVRAPRSGWRLFWRRLLEYGEVLLGVGKRDQICDRLLLDAENCRVFLRFRPEWIKKGEGYDGGETLDDIFADPDWPSWRARIAASSPLAQSVWDTWKSWDIYTDERVFLFDACMRQYQANRLYGLVQVAKEYLPRLQAFEYSTCLATCGTHPSDRGDYPSLKPYGVGGTTDGVSVACYGQFERARWYWPTRAEQRWNRASCTFSFAVLLTQLTRLANMINGSSHPRAVFLAYQRLPLLPGYLSEGDWAELVCHAVLLCGDGGNLRSGGIHFYQAETVASPEVHRKFCVLVRERDEVVKYANAVAVPPAPIASYDQGLLISSVVAGGRQVYRVTPNAVVKTKVNETAEGIEFSNTLKTVKIAGGRLHERSQSANAPVGWWVIGPSES